MKHSRNKIVTQNELQKIRPELCSNGKKMVMCHGVYDLLHYGHLEHLKEAKQQGDILIVSVTSAAYVNKGPDRPYYNDNQRLEFLASLEMVDYVVLSESPDALDNIRVIRPDIFVKGQEFQSGDDGITGNIASEIQAVQELGGKVYYTQGEVHSSSKLLNNYFNALPDEVLMVSHQIKSSYGDNAVDQVFRYVDDFRKLKVLVVGDIIIDEYIFCRAQGLTSKDTVISTRYENEERYLGGSLAIANHIANFCDNVTILSMMGMESQLCSFIRDNLNENIKSDILCNQNFTTPIKRRFLKRHPQRDEYDKLFSINMLNNEMNHCNIDYSDFYAKLKGAGDFDLVVLCDYGHGLIDQSAIRIIEKESRYLSLNCQTNSSNYGTNLITKYNRADAFALDEKELRLAYGQAAEELPLLLEKLLERLNSKMGWLTLGAKGALAINEKKQTYLAPALTLHVIDTVGAGDAFYAIASLCAAINMPEDIATLLSNGAGALKTHMVGNSASVGRTELLKFIRTVLNV